MLLTSGILPIYQAKYSVIFLDRQPLRLSKQVINDGGGFHGRSTTIWLFPFANRIYIVTHQSCECHTW